MEREWRGEVRKKNYFKVIKELEISKIMEKWEFLGKHY